MPRQSKARPASAEFLLERLAHHSGPIVGGGVRIAIVQDVQRSRSPRMRNLFEKWNQAGCALQRTGLMHRSLAYRFKGHALKHG